MVLSTNRERVVDYYSKRESELGYRVLLRGVRHFGWYEPGERAWPWTYRSAQLRMEQRLTDALRVGSGDRVLDAGCGEGAVAVQVGRSGAQVHGIDVVADSIRRARLRAGEPGSGPESESRFSVGDYHEILFPDGHFDALYTMETLVHARSPRTVLAEMHRVLEPGGRAVLVEYSSAPAQDAAAGYEWLQRVCRLAEMPAWIELTHGRLDTYASDAGFTVERTEDLTANIMPMLKSFSDLAHVPYRLAKALGQQDRYVNGMSAYELHRHPACWRYAMHTLVKQP